MTAWLYRWLPIVCGCHCRDDRSFHYHGRKFPVCARCTGELIGMLACVLSCACYLPGAWTGFALLVPLVVDGFTQRLTRYESTNFRRVVTGLLFGYGLMALVIQSHIAVFWFGYNLRK